MKTNVAVTFKIALVSACVIGALAAPSAKADNFFGSFLGSLTGGVGGGSTKGGDNAPNKNDSVEGMQERRYSYLETAEGAGARASTQPSFGFGGSDIRDAKGSAQSGMIMGAKLNGTLYSEIPMTPLATINFPVASKAQENEMYTHCPPLTGYHLTDSADYINTAIANDVLLGKLSDPERWVNVAKATQQAQNTQTGNMMAEMARNQANSAIDFCSTYMTNFTTSKRWNDVRDKLFIPIAILLLLPGAMLAQVKSIVAAGNPVLEESHPFDGLLRSIVAIFLIPATCLVLNYGIDLSNSLTYTIKTEYQNLFHDDMYQSAICAEVRAFPVRQESENRGALDLPTTKMGQLLPEQKTVFARVEGQLFSTKLEDPCAGLYIAPKDRADEALPTNVVAARLAFNSMNAVLCAGWNALCAFQTVYLYYLWLMGPIVAALWVWPMKFLRDALPSWIEGCVTLCFWSLLWNTTILLMACFRGYDETGTFVMTALNTLATICVKYSFDFVQLVMAAGSQANAVGEKLGEAMKASSGSGGGSSSRSGHGGGNHHTHGGGHGAGPTTRPSTSVNAAHVLGGVAGGASGHGSAGAGAGAGALGGGAGGAGGHGGASGAGGGSESGGVSSPLSLMAGHAGGMSSGVGGGLGAISHAAIPGSHGGVLPALGNLSHGAPPIAGIVGAAAAAGGHGLPPSAQFDIVSNSLNSATHNMSSLNSSMLHGDVTNLSAALHGAGGASGSVFNSGDITHMAGGIAGSGIGSVFNSDVTHMAGAIGGASILNAASSTFNGGDITSNGANLNSLFEGADIDSTLNAAFNNVDDISNINSAMNFANGTTMNAGDINMPPLSANDIDNNVAMMLGDDVSNVANSMTGGADVTNMSSSMSASISGDVNVGGSSFSATMNGGDVNNSNSSNAVSNSAVHSNSVNHGDVSNSSMNSTSNIAGNVLSSFASTINGGDVSSNINNAANLTNSIAASMVNNLDVNNSMNAASNFSNVVDQGVDISSTMASSMDMTNVSTTNSSMTSDVDVSSSSSASFQNNVDVNSIGPSSLNSSSTSTTYDVDNNASHNVDSSNAYSSTYASGGSQYVSNSGDTSYASYSNAGSTYSNGGSSVQYNNSSSNSEYRSANNAANIGAAMQNSIANSLGGGAPQAQASAMQQMYQMFDGGNTNVGGNSISSTSASSFDSTTNSNTAYSASTSASFDSSSSYVSSSNSQTSYSDNSSVSAPPQVSYTENSTSAGASYSQPSYTTGDSASAAAASAPAAYSQAQYVSSNDAGASYSSNSSSSSNTNTTHVNYGDSSASSSSQSAAQSAATEYARYAMSEHTAAASHAAAGAPPVHSGEMPTPPSMIVVPMQSFNKQAASLHDAVKQGIGKSETKGEPKPETNAKPTSKLGNALRGAGCPLPAGDKTALPPSTKKPAATNAQFTAGATESAPPPPASRTDAMDISATNTRNRYRQTRKMTEEELQELADSAETWLV
jgi:hypothetical protein